MIELSWRRPALGLVVGVAVLVVVSASAQGALPPAAKIIDSETVFHERPYPVISPDGMWVAYFSRGFVCAANVSGGDARRLFEVPNSWPPSRATVENKNTIFELQWTHESDGVVFGVQSYDNTKRLSRFEVWLVTLNNTSKKLAHEEHDIESRGLGYKSVLTRDRKYVVATLNWPRPLIWDLATNGPRATPFLSLTPSTTSGRWIGIEKDTRQLVLLDNNFAVTARIDEFLPSRSFGVRLDWSPDENFVIFRNQVGFDHHNNWEGFHLDLGTGLKRKLAGIFMDELIVFTGRGGEFFRAGQDGVRSKGFSGDLINGAHLTIVPEGNDGPRDIWRLTIRPNKRRQVMLTNRPGNPPVRMSPDGELFAIGIPRPPGERSGCFWHLMTRDRKSWRFPGEDNGAYVSPYELVGFAGDGKVIVAYDAEQLFALPISEIMTEPNETNK
jgi:hypothetical protein